MMEYVDEYRDPDAAHRYADAIAACTMHPWSIMEVCGGQTHAIVKYGIDRLLPDAITLVHGPGCPVCVTPVERIDHAIALAGQPGVILCSFGDMLRVPGSHGDLLSAKAHGADVRMVYAPADALGIAEANPDREVVFFAVGFETTAPATALALRRAHDQGLRNFSLLVAHVLVPPAIEAILSSPDNQLDGFLAAGHVCTIMGYAEYMPISKQYGVPIVVTGFEPLDILQGVLMCVRQLELGRYEVENQYSRSVRREGNTSAQALVREVFEIVPRVWRGLGEIPESGLAIRETYAEHDADRRFDLARAMVAEPTECRAGDVLRGALRPDACPAFGNRCGPEHPLGAPMVSAEGACAAYYRYRRADAAGVRP